jgi:hypothetical protein
MNTKKNALLRFACGTSMGAALVACVLAVSPQADAQGWITLENQVSEGVGTMLLLSDGSVMAQTFGATTTWYRLAPDGTGGYTNSMWTPLQSMHYTRLYYSSQVLTNGNVFVAGGEYGSGSNNAEIYNPLNNLWSVAPATPAPVGFIDSDSEMLPNGDVLISPVNPASYGETLIWNTASSTWSVGPTLFEYGDSAEASWVKLPDNSILTVAALGNSGANGKTSQRYIPSLNQWIPDANLPVQIYANLNPYYVGETGPAFLLPNGKAFFVGGTGATALYTATGDTNKGSWSAGADIPNSLVSADAPGAMMPNGQVLCAVNPAPYFTQVTNLNFGSPTYFYVYDYSSDSGGSWTQINSPTGGDTDNEVAYDDRMLVLPDGTVLFTDGGTVYDYVPGGTPVPSGQPTINSVSYTSGGNLLITGTLFNGISEGASYGDDAQMNSNYPLVRFTSGGQVYYGRTFNWNSTGVADPSLVVTTECTVPTTLPPGPCTMQVVANGIASGSVQFSGPIWVDFNYTGSTQNGTYQYPYNTIAGGISAVASGGTILINANVQPSETSETPVITKAMTIASVGGPSIIGN